MKKSSLFITSMKAMAILGSLVLVVGIYKGLTLVIKQEQVEAKPAVLKQDQNIMESEESKAQQSLKGLVIEISNDRLKMIDIQTDKQLNVILQNITMIEDANSHTIPFDNIKLGDMIQVIYEPQKDRVLKLTKLKEQWTKQNIKGISIDQEAKTVVIGENVYKLKPYTLISDKNNQIKARSEIGSYDSLEIKGIEDVIYSIKVIEQGGGLLIEGLPPEEGIIEIDTNRQMNLKDLQGPIAVAKGKHRIVIKLKGYELLVQEVEVAEGQTQSVKIENITRAYGDIHVQMMSEVEDYSVEIDNNRYKGDQNITLAYGSYRIKVNAPEYKSWAGDITINRPSILLNVALEPLETKKDTVAENQQATVKTDTTKYMVSIATVPSGAKVYIRGSYKGNTPYTEELELGSYSVLLQKMGYESQQAIIEIKDEKSQLNYTYTLKPTALDIQGELNNPSLYNNLYQSLLQ